MQPLKVTLLQTDTVWHAPDANRALFEGLISRVPAGTALVVLPEMFSTGFTMASAQVAETMQGDTVSWMRERAREGGFVVCGSLVVEEQGQYFNRFVWMTPTGEVATYDKRHRFRMAGEHEHYAAGRDKLIVDLCGWRVCPMICYDLRFPVWLRNQDDYDMLLVVANWPAARREAWDTLLRARAIENQAYVCAVNIVGQDGNGVRYSGGTIALGPEGAVVGHTADAPTELTVTLEPQPLRALREAFPVWQDADEFNIAG